MILLVIFRAIAASRKDQDHEQEKESYFRIDRSRRAA
jgi:hypothetical protein